MCFIPEEQHNTQIADSNLKRPWHISNDCKMKIMDMIKKKVFMVLIFDF